MPSLDVALQRELAERVLLCHSCQKPSTRREPQFDPVGVGRRPLRRLSVEHLQLAGTHDGSSNGVQELLSPRLPDATIRAVVEVDHEHVTG